VLAISVGGILFITRVLNLRSAVGFFLNGHCKVTPFLQKNQKREAPPAAAAGHGGVFGGNVLLVRVRIHKFASEINLKYDEFATCEKNVIGYCLFCVGVVAELVCRAYRGANV
jgi:hypothetical protein